MPPARTATLPRPAFAVAAAGVVAYAVSHALGDAGAGVRDWLSPLLYLWIAVLVAHRAVRRPGDRVAWGLLAAGIAAYGGGSVAFALDGRPDLEVPAAAHAGWLAFYVVAYAAVVALLRARMRALATTLALDGLLGALALAIVATSVVVGGLRLEGIADVDAVLGLSYAAADVLLLGLVLWAAWLSGRAGARMWLVLACGVGLVLAGDLVLDAQALTGGFEEASVFRALYPLGMLTLAVGAWQPAAIGRPPRVDSLAVVLLPCAAVVVGLVAQSLPHGSILPESAHWLSIAVFALAAVRAVVTYRQLVRIKEGRRFLRGFEDAAIGMALVTPDGRWLRVNAALCALLGRRAEDLRGRAVAEVMAGGLAPGEDVERRLVRPDATVVEALCHTVLVDEDGDLPYLFAQIQDVTARNRATRHSAALAELGRLAIDENDPAAFVACAMPVVAAAIGARSCAIDAGVLDRAAGAVHVPLGRRERAPLEVLVADRDTPPDELDARFLEAAAAVLGGALDRADAEAEIRRRALHDPLTGLANRTFLMAHVEQQLAGAGRGDGSVALLLLDIDRFKMVNDTLGHTTGDDLLREVASRLRAVTRAGDLVARLGGDEFVVACRDLAGPEEAAALAERVVAALREPFVLGGRELVLGASVGVAAADASVRAAAALLRDADVAMYRAKDGGGSRHVVFDAALRAGVVQRMTLEVELRRALERGELRLHYQPILRLAHAELAGFEALLRWEHPEHGLVPPGDFIPIAEETGMIVPIGAWVVDEACRQLAIWNAGRDAEPLHMGVNLSARQIAPELVDTVRDALERHGVAPETLVIELTESLLVERDEASAVLADLRALGVVTSLDDFGTGYSSLGYLSEYAIDIVKLDRSLIARVATSSRARGLVRGVLEMAGALGLEVLAEGIEDADQAAAANELGCVFGQGWLYSRALPADEAGRIAADGFALPA